MYSNDSLLEEFVKLLKISRSNLRTLCRKSAVIGEPDQLFSDSTMLAFPLMLSMTFRAAQLACPNIVIVAQHIDHSSRIENYCDGSGRQVYQRHSDNTSGWCFYVPQRFGGSKWIAEALSFAVQENRDGVRQFPPVYLLFDGYHFDALQRQDAVIEKPRFAAVGSMANYFGPASTETFLRQL